VDVLLSDVVNLCISNIFVHLCIICIIFAFFLRYFASIFQLSSSFPGKKPVKKQRPPAFDVDVQVFWRSSLDAFDDWATRRFLFVGSFGMAMDGLAALASKVQVSLNVYCIYCG